MSNHKVAIRMFLNKKEAQDLLNNGDFEQLVNSYVLFVKELENTYGTTSLSYGEMTDVLVETFGVNYILNKFKYLNTSTLDGCESLKNTVIELSPEYGCKCNTIDMVVLKKCGVRTLIIDKKIYINQIEHLFASNNITTKYIELDNYYIWEFSC